MSKYNRTRKRLFKLFGRRSLKAVPARIVVDGKEQHPLREMIQGRLRGREIRG